MAIFTVVGVYEDSGQFWVDDVDAKTADDAANKTRKEYPRLDQIIVLEENTRILLASKRIPPARAR